MSLLEWLLLTELLFLFCGWVLWIAGRLAAKNSPNDAILKFAQTFWRTLRHRPAPLREVVPDADIDGLVAPDGSDQELLSSLAGAGTAQCNEDEDDEKAPDAPLGIRMATLNVTIVPRGSRNQISGYLGKALKIQVTAPPEGGQANKEVIELLATTLALKSHQIQLIKGIYAEQKVLQIAGLSQTELDEKLSSFR